MATLDPLARRSSSVYDPAGRIVAAIDALSFRSTTVYDVAGQAVAALDPLVRRGTTAYDLAGRPLARVNPLKQRTTTVYDAAGQVIGMVDPRTCRVSTAYDRAGRRSALTDPNGNVTTFAYDVAGQEVLDTDPLGRWTTFAYDPAGRRTLRVDPRGVAVTTVYDAAGRRVNDLFPGGPRATYAYDAASRPTLAADAAGRVSTAYDPKGRVTSTVNPDGKTIGYAYDAADRRLYLTDPDGGRTSYSHDPAGRLKVLTEPRGNATTFAYDPTGRRVLQLGANTACLSSVYDGAGQLTRLSTTAAGASVSRFTYAYDPASRRTGAWQAAAGALVRCSWSYDPAGQLVRETRTGIAGFDTTYTYDPAGNRTAQIDSGVRTSYAYDDANELLTARGLGGLTSYTYDPAGNRTVLDAPSATTYYAWDARGRLSTVEPVAGTVTFAYDAQSRRLGKQTPTANTHYVYDFDKVLQETDGSGVTQNQYLNTEEQYGDLMSAYGGGQGAYYAFDALGSADALLDDSGSATDRYAYRAFGLAAHTQGTSGNARTFVARQGYQWVPEVDLYLPLGRPYDPDAHGFLSPDPARASVNLYDYCGNDPVNATDPSGLFGAPSKQWLAQDIKNKQAAWDAFWKGLDYYSDWAPRPGSDDPIAHPRPSGRFDPNNPGGLSWNALSPEDVAREEQRRKDEERRVKDEASLLRTRNTSNPELGVSPGEAAVVDKASQLFAEEHSREWSKLSAGQRTVLELVPVAVCFLAPEALGWVVGPTEETFAALGGRDVSSLTNQEVGDVGEAVARRFLEENRYRDITAIQNGSGNGIDIIARSEDGRLGFFEVKSSRTGQIKGLSARQTDMRSFVEDVLTQASQGRGRYQNLDAATQDAARDFLRGFRQKPESASGTVIGVDLANKVIRVSPWK